MKEKIKIKNKKMSSKIALLTSAMLLLIFLILITVSSSLTGKGLKESSFNLLEQLSDSNGNTIQQIMNEADRVSSGITAYLAGSVQDRAALEAATVEIDGKKPEPVMYTSALFPTVKLDAYSMQTENYLCATVRNAVLQSEDIV
ncbi:MAG: hypothetical protein RR087_07070, partial [Oscillospiraceae bacterium]